MSRDLLIDGGMIGWFIVLAVAEVAIAHEPDRGDSEGGARLATNFGLTSFILLANGIFPLANVAASVLAGQLGIGLVHHVAMPWLVVLALTLVAQTFASYWAHRLMHQLPLLWRIHRVHHADTAVDVSTSLRNHPFELLFTLPVSSLVILLIGAPVSVVIAFQTIVLAAAVWQHADIDLAPRLDRALRVLVFTPRLHRLHHNPVPIVHDSNFGELFTVWDRVFGTLTVMEGRGRVGLDGQVARPDDLLQQIWSPLRPA